MRYLLILMILASCGKPKVESVGIIAGENGKDGENGHSLVSESFEANECENGGSRLDIFLDVDDSLSVSEGDIFQNSLIACNGAQGEQGIQGLVGENGAQGEVGPRGLRGPRGPIGPQGLDGATGAVGPRGEDGDTGSPGPVGPAGPQGIQGIQGTAGVSASGCTLVFKPNQGRNGRKYILTCGSVAITFTADEEGN